MQPLVLGFDDLLYGIERLGLNSMDIIWAMVHG